jgi:hypothetical protein
MTDLATGFTVIEKAIVDWLEHSGHAVIHEDDEWMFIGPKWPFVKQPISITALTCAIVQALEQKK